MDTFLKSLTDGASDAGSLARSIAESGLKSVSQAFRGMKIFGALSTSTADHVDYNATHYVLVPLLGAERSVSPFTPLSPVPRTALQLLMRTNPQKQFPCTHQP